MSAIHFKCSDCGRTGDFNMVGKLERRTYGGLDVISRIWKCAACSGGAVLTYEVDQFALEELVSKRNKLEEVQKELERLRAFRDSVVEIVDEERSR